MSQYLLRQSCMHACSVAKSCLALCNPMDCSPPSSSVHGILLARILKWVAISRGSFSGKIHSPEDLPDPGLKPASPALQVDSLPLSHVGSPYQSCNQGKNGGEEGWRINYWVSKTEREASVTVMKQNSKLRTKLGK